MTTGEKIKYLRVQKGMSQEELGAKIGVKKAAVHKYENGIIVNLKRSTIEALAKALDTSATYLFDDTFTESDDPTPPEQQKKARTIADLTEEELFYLKKYREATPEIKKAIQRIVDDE